MDTRFMVKLWVFVKLFNDFLRMNLVESVIVESGRV